MTHCRGHIFRVLDEIMRARKRVEYTSLYELTAKVVSVRSDFRHEVISVHKRYKHGLKGESGNIKEELSFAVNKMAEFNMDLQVAESTLKKLLKKLPKWKKHFKYSKRSVGDNPDDASDNSDLTVISSTDSTSTTKKIGSVDALINQVDKEMERAEQTEVPWKQEEYHKSSKSTIVYIAVGVVGLMVLVFCVISTFLWKYMCCYEYWNQYKANKEKLAEGAVSRSVSKTSKASSKFTKLDEISQSSRLLASEMSKTSKASSKFTKLDGMSQSARLLASERRDSS